ncbi:MAG: SurA N-terminal domain-containing protein [Gammaproteobacteria bacterium]
MLQKMRNQTESLAFKIVVGILIVVLAVFGFGAIDLFSNNDPDMAEVNGEMLTQGMVGVQVERERRRIAAQMGDQFDPATLDPVQMQESVLEQMIARELMAQAAQDLGLTASDAAVARTIRENPNFAIDGRFEEGRYRMVTQALGYSPQEFLAETRELLTLEQLQGGVGRTAFSTDADLKALARLLGQRRDLAWLAFDDETFASQVNITDADVETRYQENLADYQTPERLDVEFVTLRSATLAEDPSITVTEDAIVAAYETDRAAAPVGEERSSRHILLTLKDDRDEQAAIKTLSEIADRVASGESFQDIAKSISEDPGSAPTGGDLGFAGRGVFDPAFETALFAIEQPGGLSPPTVTPFGVHLIQLEAVRAVEYPSLDVERPGIEARLRQEQANSVFDERKRELDNLAFERPDDLAGIAQQLGLSLEDSTGVTRETGEGVFAQPLVRDALFLGDVLDKGFNTAVLEPEPGVAVVARVTQRHEPAQIPLADIAEALKATMVTEAARALGDEARDAADARLRRGDSVTDVALAYGLEWQRSEAARRGQSGVPPAVLEVAFRLDRPAEGGKSIGTATLDSGDSALVTVTRVQDGSLDALTGAERDNLRRLSEQRNARVDFGGFYATLEQDADIERVN